MIAPSFFEPPTEQRVMLPQQPRLASWMAVGHPDRVRLGSYLDETLEAAQPLLAEVNDPISVFLGVGLLVSVPLLDQLDLDNYLYPLAGRIAKAGRQMSSVWGAKRTNGRSCLTIGSAVACKPDPSLAVVFAIVGFCTWATSVSRSA